MPTTKLGRLSMRLLAALIGIFAVAVALSMIYEARDETGTPDVMRAVLGISFLVTALGSAGTAAVAIARDGERSAMAWAAVLLGLLATAFALGDVVAP